MPSTTASWIHHATSYPGTFAQVFTLLEGSNSASACLYSPYPSFKTKLKHLSMKILLIPTLHFANRPGCKSENLAHLVSSQEAIIVLSNSWSWPGFFSSLWQLDRVPCERLEINETFDLKQDSRLLKCELRKLHIVQWGRRISLRAQIWRLFLVYEHLCLLPTGAPYLSAPAQLLVQSRHLTQICSFWGTKKEAQRGEDLGSLSLIFSLRFSDLFAETHVGCPGSLSPILG